MADDDKEIVKDNPSEENVEINLTTPTSTNKNMTIEEKEENTKNLENTENTADDENVKKDDSAENDNKSKEDEDTVNPEDVDLENPEDVSNALDKKGVDYNALAEEYIKKGKLSDESMASLAAVGISAEMVNDYIKGYEARAELERNELAECVGGRESLEEIINWAANNLKKEEIIALNEIRNKFELKAVLRGLKTDMEEKEGKAPNYQKGTGDKPTVNGFRSQAEMFEAIKDPKYNKDEAYRADVQKKIAASREAGIDLGIY